MKKSIIYLIVFCNFFIIGCSNIDRGEKISKNFTMGEAIHSNYAESRNIRNNPSSGIRRNIRYTARRMEEVRKILGRPLQITSWYRSPKLNRAVGGSHNSSHSKGLAVDILLKKGQSGRAEFEKLKKRMKSYDQLIYYPKRGHLHIGFRRNKSTERRQVMVKK